MRRKKHEGGDSALGTNFNLLLPKGCDDEIYLQALDQAFETARGFQPNWMVLSAGYDTCAADPSTFFKLSDEVYNEIGARIGQLGHPLVIIHEGGYAVEHNGLLSVRMLGGIIDSIT